MALPSVASAYDGYCYARQREAQTNGTVIGAIAGAALGSNIAGRGDRTEGAIAGAVLGGVVGNSAGRNSVDCYEGRYYSYDDSGYYDPPPPPRGYVAVYYNDRPRYGYRNVYRERYYGHYGPPPRAYYRDRDRDRHDRYDRHDRHDRHDRGHRGHHDR
ncbi:glycine zipper 2TM domain-containing protein [Asticcacaulis sp. ZE23SCel15]|uniref:glycine zipper 2TM domain-containing protein n=1 Tax=Asticcacaulis sp. ZE23SCel15 TaxID=3059027 RepID=UPI00265E28B6|nr:glycine zipper 2TM domain-containing protein [Asticcacaulis sp. ZE23SCel15]WKL56664.1 glycine zipper 2TM domain-containing protein [Asticcacaulis sp. ZE23SCel15]